MYPAVSLKDVRRTPLLSGTHVRTSLIPTSSSSYTARSALAMFERGDVLADVVIRIGWLSSCVCVNERVAVARIDSASEKRPSSASKSVGGGAYLETWGLRTRGKRTCRLSFAG
jgi:hypothetical protein